VFIFGPAGGDVDEDAVRIGGAFSSAASVKHNGLVCMLEISFQTSRGAASGARRVCHPESSAVPQGRVLVPMCRDMVYRQAASVMLFVLTPGIQKSWLPRDTCRQKLSATNVLLKWGFCPAAVGVTMRPSEGRFQGRSGAHAGDANFRCRAR